MKRPTLALKALIGALAVVLAGGCSSFADSDSDVARVGDATLSVGQLEALVTAPTDGSTLATTPSQVEGTTARPAISAWVVTQVLTDDVEARGSEITSEDRLAAEEQLALQFQQQWATTAEPVKDLLIERSAALNKWNQVPVDPASMEPFRADYEQGIEASGVACTGHILVETQAEAEEVLAELDGTTDGFAALAEERSIDEAAAASGGVIPCTPVEEFAGTNAPEYVQAALSAEMGVPVGPVQTQFGSYVIVVRPFDDAVEELATVYSAERFAELAPDAGVYVDPRYGAFDPETALVEPLGGASTPS